MAEHFRFGNATNLTIEELKKGAKNQNTIKSTNFWLSVWKKWCEEREILSPIEDYEPDALNKLLEQFYAEIKNKNGDDYEPDSLKVMIAALDRYLKDKHYKWSIIKDREFSSSKSVLEGKAKLLREAGRGKRPNKARQLSREEEEILWKEGKLGSATPEALINTMWWLLTQYFGLRGRQEHRDMKMDDFKLCKDDDGIEYVEFTEGPTKTRQGGLHMKNRDFQPRMFAVGGERCPLDLFKKYIYRRPLSLQSTGPFYISIKANRRVGDKIWFKDQPMGVNKLNAMMKTMITGTSLENSDKNFTNHSARKTVVSKLKKANVERSGIVKVTGHRNIQSLDDYDESNEEEQRRLSLAISRRNNSSSSTITSVGKTQAAQTPAQQQQHESLGASSPTPFSSADQFSSHDLAHSALSMNPMINSKEQRILNTFNNCQVSFNLSSMSSTAISSPCAPQPVQPSVRKRRYHIIESDSDSD